MKNHLYGKWGRTSKILIDGRPWQLHPLRKQLRTERLTIKSWLEQDSNRTLPTRLSGQLLGGHCLSSQFTRKRQK